ncbi:MAG: acetyl-CoA carboxylase carboxyltransferase subunit beta [Syntrophomonadaceae bacterium]|nr:acetyl-CoA carboxylase carboxyltransferase subunit beta [Syntrophomonadaceae bacterium]
MLKDRLGFKSRTRYATVRPRGDASVQALDGERCPGCGNPFPDEDDARRLMVCPDCGYHFPLGVWDRIQLITDEDRFMELDADFISGDPLEFPGYMEKLDSARQQTGLKEAVVTGKGTIYGQEVILGAMDGRFMMGSMGLAVGEKIARAFEIARENRLPVVMFTASGGARMQEGMVSLMQMAKTSAAVERFSRSGLLYISVLTHPTTGGVTASFATLADIVLAEPGATIGFAGARVIEQTIRQKLPASFQKSEFLLEHGMIDAIVNREELKGFLYKLLRFHKGRER